MHEIVSYRVDFLVDFYQLVGAIQLVGVGGLFGLRCSVSSPYRFAVTVFAPAVFILIIFRSLLAHFGDDALHKVVVGCKVVTVVVVPLCKAVLEFRRFQILEFIDESGNCRLKGKPSHFRRILDPAQLLHLILQLPHVV